MRKRLLAIIATAAMVVAMMPSMVFGLTPEVTGSGTEANPYVVNPTKFSEFLLSSDAKGSVIQLSAGEYYFQTPTVESYSLENITIIGGAGATVKGLTIYNSIGTHKVDGLTIKNVTFDEGGILLSATSMSNVTFDGCTFNNDARISQDNASEHISNLVVRNCKFEGADTSPVNNGSGVSAIVVENGTGVTIDNCTFENIDYNAMQLNKLDGNVSVTNNKFLSTGSRNVYFTNSNMQATVKVSGNTFSMPAVPKSDGNFIKSNTAIEIGSNTYPIELPANSNEYITDNITINEDEPAAPQTPAGPTKPATPEKSPNTGDNSMAPFAVAGLVLAAMAAVVATRRRTN